MKKSNVMKVCWCPKKNSVSQDSNRNRMMIIISDPVVDND